MTESSELLQLFDNITVWKRGNQRAPHKPLLLLMALAALRRGEPRLARFEEIEEQLKSLLMEYGPPRKSYHPEYPFWRLLRDGGLWDIPNREILEETRGDRKRAGDIAPSVLRARQAVGGFSKPVYEALSQNPRLVNEIAAKLLQGHFPVSMHESILDAVGMTWEVTTVERRRRDPAFRETIIRIYEHRCAICGFDGRLDFADLALDAAHIMWHAAGGPDSEDNGLALCVLHHRLLDRGALSLDDNHRILVSQRVYGGEQVHAAIVGFAGQPIRAPQSGTDRVKGEYIHWHRREVFRGPPREVGGEG